MHMRPSTSWCHLCRGVGAHTQTSGIQNSCINHKAPVTVNINIQLWIYKLIVTAGVIPKVPVHKEVDCASSQA